VAKLTIVGRLGADPELATTSAGEIVKYVVATNHGPAENRTTSWWRVASFSPDGKARERLLGLQKG
jgi:single-stranded DNA-binding protein